MDIDLTEQETFWKEEVGYIKNNYYTPDGLDGMYLRKYGVKRSVINYDFLDGLDRDMCILEVGCNIGNQILMLKDMGFKNIIGIDISDYALGLARQRLKDYLFYVSSARDLPFGDNSFDLVFTSGVLIHISPDDIDSVLSEIYRVSKKYIWCFEYYRKKGYKNFSYRGSLKIGWRANFLNLFLNRYPSLKVVKKKIYPSKYLKKDICFLLEKIDIEDSFECKNCGVISFGSYKCSNCGAMLKEGVDCGIK